MNSHLMGIGKIKRLFPKSLRKNGYRVIQKLKETHYRTVSIFLPKRSGRYCPCCDVKFRNFSTGQYKEKPDRFNTSRYLQTKQDVICPICGSLPRHRILASWCEKHKAFFSSSSILYFAPENCMIRWFERNGISCTTSDPYYFADLKLDIQDTGLEDNSYDIIIANHVLEHVDDFRKALREMYRILKPGGSFICSFPMNPKVELLDEEEEPLSAEERLHRFGQNDHKRVFGMKADQFLKDAGFDVEKIKGEDYPEGILPVVGPADYDMNILFCCRKPT